MSWVGANDYSRGDPGLGPDKAILNNLGYAVRADIMYNPISW